MMGSVSIGRLSTWRRLRWSIRVRSTVISAVVVFVALGIGGAALVAFVYTSAARTVDTAASARLEDITTALQQASPDRIDPILLATDRNVVAVQIVDSTGNVVRASTGAPDTPLTDNGNGARGGGDGGPRGRGPGHMQLDTASITTTDGTLTVLVAAGDGSTDATISKVAGLLAILALVITAIASAATYYLVGRSLRSMEHLRRRVGEITAADLSERVPVSKHRDEITALAQTMNDMLERLEVGQLTQRRFVSDASHELRSPLATIAGALELGRESPGSIDTDLLDHTLLPEVTRVQRIVEDLLLLARSDEGVAALRVEDIDLDDIAQNEARLLRDQTAHTIVVHLTPARIRGDHSALTRMLRNLTVNAARHATSLVAIDVRHDDTTAYLAVSDDGPGIPEQDRSRVFDRFVRLEQHRSRAQGGSGLGLAIVAEIVGAHRGHIAITDRAGGGTVITVALPLAPDDHDPTIR
jgi:two-component system OmpR family sensor kinase